MNFESLIQRQRQFFRSDRTKDIAFRRQQLSTLRHALKSREGALLDAIREDFRKSAFATNPTELGLLYQELGEGLRDLPRWAPAKSVPSNLVNLPGRSSTMPYPLGVSLVIGAWNYPCLLPLAPVV